MSVKKREIPGKNSVVWRFAGQKDALDSIQAVSLHENARGAFLHVAF
jgi:hypothetical protein